MVDIKLINNNGRVVLGNKEVDIYLQQVITTNNFSSVNNFLNSTASSGVFLFSTYPENINSLFNKNIGVVAEYDVISSGINVYEKLHKDLVLRRTDIPISGSLKIGRF